MEAVTRIIERGEYFEPVGQMDLRDSIRRMQMAYLKARFDNVPQDRLDMMVRWVDAAIELQREWMAANAPPAANNNGGPPPMGPANDNSNPLAAHVANDVQRMTAHQAAQQMMGA
jgi:hypothetical protein